MNKQPLTIMLAGATVLQCYAEIDMPVVRPQDAHWLSMNAVIFLINETGENIKLHCKFNYFREDSSEIVLTGSYAILAMVHANAHLHFIVYPHAVLTKVMGICEQGKDTLFSLQDIISVCSYLSPHVVC
jgi:hypothetical protein